MNLESTTWWGALSSALPVVEPAFRFSNPHRFSNRLSRPSSRTLEPILIPAAEAKPHRGTLSKLPVGDSSSNGSTAQAPLRGGRSIAKGVSPGRGPNPIQPRRGRQNLYRVCPRIFTPSGEAKVHEGTLSRMRMPPPGALILGALGVFTRNHPGASTSLAGSKPPSGVLFLSVPGVFARNHSSSPSEAL